MIWVDNIRGKNREGLIMDDSYTADITHGLKLVLCTIASPEEYQRRISKGRAAGEVDFMLEDFDDAAALVARLPDTGEPRISLLNRLHTMLEALFHAHEWDHWDESFFGTTAWKEVREFAQSLLQAFGWAYTVPSELEGYDPDLVLDPWWRDFEPVIDENVPRYHGDFTPSPIRAGKPRKRRR